MKRYVILLLVLTLVSMALQPGIARDTTAKIKVLVVTGGHDFEYDEFFTLFTSEEYEVVELVQPRGNEAYGDGTVMQYDVIVLYDLWEPISGKEKEGLLRYLKAGKGLVALHHSLGSYQKWDEFVSIVGGSYVMNNTPRTIGGKKYPPSTYQHDVTLPIQIVDPNHPVTKGMKNFDIYDEIYGNLLIQPDVHVLLKTKHPASNEAVAWTKRYGSAKVVCIQPGHGKHAFQNKNYKQLLQQAIQYVAK